MSDLLLKLEDIAAPAHTALVVIDMQNDFCAQGGYIDKVVKADLSGCPAVAERINVAVDAARAAGVRIVWVRANYQPELVPVGMNARNVARGISNAVCCAGGTWGYDFYGVKPREGEFFVEKHCYNAFQGTNLDDILKNQGIRSLVCTGVVTNVCVESTLRAGFFNGYYIVVPEDCVGGPSRDLHDATLKNVRMYYGTVTDAKALSELWGASIRQPLRKAS